MTVMPQGPGTFQYYNPYEAQLAQEMGLTGLTGDPRAVGGMIYMGSDYDTAIRVPKRGVFGSTGMFTVDQAEALVWRLDPEQIKRFDDAIEAGTGLRPSTFEQRKAQWSKMIGFAGEFASATGENKSPFEIAEMLAQQSDPRDRGGAGGPSTTSYSEENVNLTNPSTARSLIQQSLTSYLGRDATDDEQNSFLKALNAAEKRSPSVTKSVSTTTPGVGTSRTESETSSRGGFNPSTFAEEYAQGQEGAAEFQAATTLLDTFIGSLGARV
jgi:hypothetical protein